MRNLNTDEAAWYLDTTRQTIWRWRKKGLLAGYLLGRRWQVSVAELESAKKRVVAVRSSLTRPTFRDFAAAVLGRSKNGLRGLEKTLGRKLTPEIVAELLREEGRKQGRDELYHQLRSERRLRYPRMSEAARRRYRRDQKKGDS